MLRRFHTMLDDAVWEGAIGVNPARRRRRRGRAEAQLSRRPGPQETPTAVRELCEVGTPDLGDVCPLCTRTLAPAPGGRAGSAEHVPPHAVGGVVRARTCVDCNRRGSASEAELVRWWAQAYPARFATQDVPGYRNIGDVLLRRTTNGKFVLVVSAGLRSGVDHVLKTASVTGQLTATFTMPTSAWKVALLKSDYLAACLHLREVPRSPDADHVREIIRSGSFGLASNSIGVGEPLPFRVFRTYEVSAEAARRRWIGVALLPWAGGDVPIFSIGLGSVAFVTWPIPDQRRRALELALRQQVA